jgi:hypothetical protein
MNVPIAELRSGQVRSQLIITCSPIDLIEGDRHCKDHLDWQLSTFVVDIETQALKPYVIQRLGLSPTAPLK